MREPDFGILYVFKEKEGDIPFSYTIGNAEKGFPELLLIGDFKPEKAAMIINSVAYHMRTRGKPFRNEEFLDIGWSMPFRIRKAGERAKEDYTLLASDQLGHEDYDVFQIVLCDANKKYPEDEGVNPIYKVDMP